MAPAAGPIRVVRVMNAVIDAIANLLGLSIA
jgi:hypothetical protein